MNTVVESYLVISVAVTQPLIVLSVLFSHLLHWWILLYWISRLREAPSSLRKSTASNLFSSPLQFFCWSCSLLELSITAGSFAALYWLGLSCHFSKSLGLALTSGTCEGSGGATSDETAKTSDGEEKRGNRLVMMNYFKGHLKVLEPGRLAGEVSACNQARRSWLVVKIWTTLNGF